MRNKIGFCWVVLGIMWILEIRMGDCDSSQYQINSLISASTHLPQHSHTRFLREESKFTRVQNGDTNTTATSTLESIMASGPKQSSTPPTKEQPEKSESRFMMGMLDSLEKNWSFKKPSFFNTKIPETKIKSKESLFCRLSRRQSIIMFSFCMEDDSNNNDKIEEENSNPDKGEGHNPTQPNDHNQNKVNEKRKISEYNSEGIEAVKVEATTRKVRIKRKRGGHKKQKGGQHHRQNLYQDNLKGQDQRDGQMPQSEDDGSSQSIVVVQVPSGKNDDWTTGQDWNNYNENAMIMTDESQDQESRTDAPMSMPEPAKPSSTNSGLKLPGKSKVIVKSDASIQLLYEVNLDQLKLNKQNGEIQKMEKLKSDHIEKFLRQHLLSGGNKPISIITKDISDSV